MVMIHNDSVGDHDSDDYEQNNDDAENVIDDEDDFAMTVQMTVIMSMTALSDIMPTQVLPAMRIAPNSAAHQQTTRGSTNHWAFNNKSLTTVWCRCCWALEPTKSL